MHTKGWRQVRIIAYAALWFVWAAIPIIVLCALNPSIGPKGLLWLTTSWHPLVWIWTVSLVALFLWMLSMVDHRGGTTGTTGTQFTLGILCSLSLGLPAILLGAVPFFTLDLISLQQLLPHGNIIDLRTENFSTVSSPAIPREPNVYMIGVDISDSFVMRDDGERLENPLLAASADSPPRQDAPIDLDLVSSTISDLFGEKGILGQTWQPQDVLMIWTFDGQTHLLANNHGSTYEKQQIIQRLDAGMLKEVRGDHGAARTTNGTNILGFLKASLDELPTTYHQAKIILFSDLQHVEPIEDHGRPGEQGERIEARISTLADRINKDHKLAIMALRAGDVLGLQESGVTKDLGTRFGGLLRPESWQSDDLNHFRSRDETEKTVQLVGLYDQVIDVGTIYLKYVTSSGNQSIPSFLLLNDKTPRITVALQKRDSINTEDESTSNMRVMVGDGNSHCSLELNGGERGARELALLNDVGDSVPVKLDPGLGLRGRPKANLLVAMSPTTLYRIPISILEVEEGQVEAIETLNCVLLALNLLSVGLAVHSVRFMRRGLLHGGPAESPQTVDRQQ